MVINFDRLGQGGGSGSGSTVNWVQEVTGGTEIAKITIDGVEQNVYAPEGGGECNYQIVDDLSAITNPVEGMMAYVQKEEEAISGQDFNILKFSIPATGSGTYNLITFSNSFSTEEDIRYNYDASVWSKFANNTPITNNRDSGTCSVVPFDIDENKRCKIIIIRKENVFDFTLIPEVPLRIGSLGEIVMNPKVSSSYDLLKGRLYKYENNTWIEQHIIKTYQFNTMSQSERKALYYELTALKVIYDTDNAPEIKYYRFFTSGALGDDYYAPIQLNFARFDSGGRIDFSGLSASRGNNGNIYKYCYGIDYRGNLTESHKININTVYTAGTGISIANNVISCTVTGGTGGDGFTIVDSADSTGLAEATTNIINGTNRKYCVIDNGLPYFIYSIGGKEVQWQAFNQYSNGDGRWTIKYSNSTGHWGHIVSSLDSIRLGSTTLNESQLQSLLALIAN